MLKKFIVKKFILKITITMLCILLLGIGGAIIKNASAPTNAWGRTLTNPIVSEDTPDQSIIYKDGYYYMTYTHDDYDATSIPLMRSRTLDFKNAEKEVIFTPPTGSEYSENIWAPELQYLDNKWVIYFAASSGDSSLQRMYAIEADTQDPMGSWNFKGKIADSTDKFAIDGAVFEIDSQKYFVWSGWEGDVNVRQNIYIAPMSDRYTISGPRVEIARPTYAWECIGDPDVMEGPQPLIRNGKLFIIYSCSGSWTPDYKLGMLSMDESADPLIESNWTHHNSAVFERNDTNGVYGPGHNTFTQSPDGTEDWIIYHATEKAYDGWDNRRSRAQRFTWNEDGTPNFGVPEALATLNEE